MAAVIGWTRTPGEVRDGQAREQVRAVATEFTTGLMTYDHTDLDAVRDHVRDGATAEFASTFTTTLDDDLATTIADTEASSRASVDRVLVEVAGPGTAHAVVVLDATITSTAGSRELTDLYIELALVHRDGRWLVDDLTRLAARGAGTDGADGATGEPAEDQSQ